jgi:lipopolysaccharide transport system ATP-binding protein
LEVGTGFHPELSGRENVYLNGAILGMKRDETRRKFDEIVAFAEVERFIDTPVKRYSSGMYVRLAFAVAAHLDADILIVDEVLAVGDAGFQEKCLNVLRQVGNRGVTVFFVSHNMASIRNLCSRCLLMEKGEIARDGEPDPVVAAYLGDESVATAFDRGRQPNGRPTMVHGSLVVVGDEGRRRIQLHLTIAGGSERKVNLDQRLFDAGGTPVGFGSLAGLRDNSWITLSGDETRIVVSFPVDMLVDGRYFLSLDLTLPGVEYFDRVEHGLTFELARPPEFGRRRLSQNSGVGVVEFPMRLESLGDDGTGSDSGP